MAHSISESTMYYYVGDSQGKADNETITVLHIIHVLTAVCDHMTYWGCPLSLALVVPSSSNAGTQPGPRSPWQRKTRRVLQNLQ